MFEVHALLVLVYALRHILDNYHMVCCMVYA
jgi:hypothetical protein